MSELSVVQGEYERLSKLLRSLNRALILRESSRFRSTGNQNEEGQKLCSELREGLTVLREELETVPKAAIDEEDTLAEALRSVPAESRDSLEAGLSRVLPKLGVGLAALSQQDLETLNMVGSTLDRASAILFRRIQQK